MNSLVALGGGAAWSYSTVALLAPGLMPAGSAVVYFEAAAVIVTLILTGRWFEARAKGQAGAAIARLIDLQPAHALVRHGDDWIETPVAALRVGDVLRIQPGARIPTDAEVSAGESRVDESMITGEPTPVRKSAGDTLTVGAANGTGTGAQFPSEIAIGPGGARRYGPKRSPDTALEVRAARGEWQIKAHRAMAKIARQCLADCRRHRILVYPYGRIS